ncbi:MAG: hypothetical protein JWR78_4696, partial [Mycobacterium sp.]|nr:hypothetical protein [Mycobacterium sp.]
VGMLIGGILPAAPVPVVVSSAVAVVVLFAVILRAMPQRLRPTAMRTEPVSLTESVEQGSGKDPDVR